MSGKYLGSLYVMCCEKEVYYINKNCSGLSDKNQFLCHRFTTSKDFLGKATVTNTGKIIEICDYNDKTSKNLYL